MNFDNVFTIWILAGVAGAISYRIAPPIKDWCKSRFTTRVMVTSAEEAYYWLIKWVAAQSVWASSYQIRMLTHSVKDTTTASTWQDEHREAVLGPGPGTWWFKFEGRWWWCELTHTHRDNSDRPLETINIGCLGRRHDALQRLIDAASKQNQKPDGYVRIFRQQGNSWESPLLRPGRRWDTLALCDEADALLGDAERFYDAEDWYRERGIPWRRGYLLHGTPGTGKSSLVHALATQLDRDIYILNLSGMGDSGLQNLMCTMPEGAIVVIEDIDIAQPERSRSASEDEDADGGKKDLSLGVTLAGLLNAIDGIMATEGRLLVCTTNYRDRLDPALTRAGRCDVHVEMPKANAAARRYIQQRIAGEDWELDLDDPSPADVQEASIARATVGSNGQT